MWLLWATPRIHNNFNNLHAFIRLGWLARHSFHALWSEQMSKSPGIFALSV